jgi:hypothetical protein
MKQYATAESLWHSHKAWQGDSAGKGTMEVDYIRVFKNL